MDEDDARVHDAEEARETEENITTEEDIAIDAKVSESIECR